MNSLSIFVLKSLKHIYAKVNSAKPIRPDCIQDLAVASKSIHDGLKGDQPFMVARFGANEINCMANYHAISQGRDILGYMTGKSQSWWWNQSILRQMESNAGFFPATEHNAKIFSELMISCAKQVDILGSWLSYEMLFEDELAKAKKVELQLLNPFFAEHPWTQALAGKRVLVVHPFSESIKKQYLRKDKIFPNGLLPDFKLSVIKAVQSLGGQSDQFTDWFQALDYMKDEMDKVDYDVCIIGCGAYGFPLAAHAKKQGKKAIHLGGITQMLFGIKGRRWDDLNLNKESGPFISLMNEYWVRPDETEKPAVAGIIEGACYW